MAKTRKRRQRHRGGDDSSFFSSSSSDEMSAEEAPLPGASDIRAIIIDAMRETQVKQTMEIKRMLDEHKDELKEMKEHLKKLTEDHILLRTQLEQLNCSTGDRSLALRAEQNQMKPPRFRLKITSVVNETVETRKNIQTSIGNYIEVKLYDGAKQIAPDHPLASAEIMMVVLNGEFNKDDTQYNWTKEDFNKSIIRPRQGNSVSEDENKRIESVVSKCTFYLVSGIHRHSGATIVNNSGNKNVRLGVMLLSHSEERVLEGLSNHFLVRDPPKKSIKQRKALGYGQEQNGPSSSTHDLLSPTYIQTAGINVIPEQLPIANMDNTLVVDIPHQLDPINDQLRLVAEGDYQTTLSPIGFQFQDHIVFPVQLLWDRPYVLPDKSWNLLDELMPLYTSQTKVHSSNFASICLMPQHYDPLAPYQSICFNDQVSFLTKLMRKLEITTMPKQVMQNHQNRGVLIQPIELDPDDKHDEPPLKRKLHKKYRLQFVNKVCKTYYTWEQIEADNGDLLKIALYDEDNMTVTSGPLSSVSIEIVALHGDFNTIGQDEWTSEEFSSYLVSPRSIKETPVLGGHLMLVLANGEACIDSAFFQKTSVYARTEKFKMGVMLASTQDERVQEGISKPFWVRNRQGKCSTSIQHCPQLADDVYLPGNITQNEDHREALVVGDTIMKNSKMDEGTELCLQGTLFHKIRKPETLDAQDDKFLPLTGINKEAANNINDSHKQKVAPEQLVAFHGDGAKEFTVAELSAATYNFQARTVIGKGGFGSVYKGRLADGREVAIKRMGARSIFREEDFQREIAILKALRHRHVIRLLGWSVQEERRRRLLSSRKKEKERMLVYEYMSNGSLSEHLHSQASFSSLVRTSWKIRIEILLGVSRAIEYLHCYAALPVIHRDIKPHNILLDESWVPRLTDFGLSVTYHKADENKFGVAGTVGYLDLEYAITGYLKPESDIYSFGIVMLEVLSGRKPRGNLKELLREREYMLHQEREYIEQLLQEKEFYKEFLQEREFTEGSFSREVGIGTLQSITRRIEFIEVGEVEKVPEPTSRLLQQKDQYIEEYSQYTAIWMTEFIEAGEFQKVLDKRTEVPEPTLRQLEALELVAQTAASCVRPQGVDRPAISDIVASLERALELAS